VYTSYIIPRIIDDIDKKTVYSNINITVLKTPMSDNSDINFLSVKDASTANPVTITEVNGVSILIPWDTKSLFTIGRQGSWRQNKLHTNLEDKIKISVMKSDNITSGLFNSLAYPYSLAWERNSLNIKVISRLL
jgi:hypothetical protein